jgi:predicted kinase
VASGVRDLTPELVLFVGLPASGKSTYYYAHLAGTHVHVSRDLMPAARNRDARQLAEIEKALGAGKSVVVDNTNPSPQVRAPLIAVGRRHGARVIAVYFPTEVRVAIMRNRGREGAARVPNVAIFTTQKKLVPPSMEEGFDEVRIVSS